LYRNRSRTARLRGNSVTTSRAERASSHVLAGTTLDVGSKGEFLRIHPVRSREEPRSEVTPGPHEISIKEHTTPERTAHGSVDQSIMNSEWDIPHNRTHRDQTVIKKDRVGPEYVREITHELRTPLNVIIGLCQYLERDQQTPLSERQRDTVSRMERNANALLVTVNRLIETLRTESRTR
jgi:signal transduction histidine kinase